MYPVFRRGAWAGSLVAAAALATFLLPLAIAPAAAATGGGGQAKAEAPADSPLAQAVQAAIWGMPIVSVDAMREAYFRDAGARYHDIVYWSRPADWRNQTTTPNSSSLYVYINYNLKDGPVVLDLPTANGVGIFGGVLDAWQVPLVDVGRDGEDKGKGGRYVLLPPGYQGEPPAGAIAVRSSTFNAYTLIRVTPETLSQADLAKAVAYVHTMRVSRLAEVASTAPQRFINMDGKLFDGIVRFDDSYFQRLARMMGEEPARPRDADAYARLRALGIEPGKPFVPDAAASALLRTAAAQARESFRATLLAGVRPWWPGSHWGTSVPGSLGIKTGFTFDDGQKLDTNLRGAFYFLAYAPPQKLGKATFYLSTWRDGEGRLLDGAARYRLHVPARVPAREFWAVNVYDSETSGFLRQSPRVSVDSYDRALQRNADGSIDVFFGPTPPEGKPTNWVYTAPGKQWFATFRLYGPELAVFDKSWVLPDLLRD